MNNLFINQKHTIVEAVCVESSNVCGDSAWAYAVTKIYRPDSDSSLTNVLSSYNLPEPRILKGFSYAETENWTVADDIIKKYKTFSEEDEFKVILLKKECIEEEMHGYAGHKVYRVIGVISDNPIKLSNVA